MTILKYDRSRRRTWRGDRVMARVRLANRRRERAQRIGDPAQPRTLGLMMVVVFGAVLWWLG